MTRTLFVGEPIGAGPRGVRARGRGAGRRDRAARGGRDGDLELPSGRELDALARELIEADGRWPAFGHGLGHGIGLATHEAAVARVVPPTDAPLPSPTVFSVEPGIYLEGETGVRIEDLVFARRERRQGRAPDAVPARAASRRRIAERIKKGPAGCPTGPLAWTSYWTGRKGGTLKLPLPRTPLMSDVFMAYWSVA